MNIKLLILSLIIFLKSASIGQSLKIDTFKTPFGDTSSVIRWRCRAGQSVITKDQYPLVIINGKTFKNCLLENIFFDLNRATISAIQILNPKNDSIKLYGRGGKNGVIIITTKKPIEWISAKQILKQQSSAILSSHKLTLIKVDSALFDSTEELFFQKNLIENISVMNNTKEYYGRRQFNSILKITMAKESVR